MLVASHPMLVASHPMLVASHRQQRKERQERQEGGVTRTFALACEFLF